MILLELLVKEKKLNEKNKMVKGFSKQTEIKLTSSLQEIHCVSINYQLFFVS